MPRRKLNDSATDQPQGDGATAVARMTVPQLKDALRQRGLPVSGVRSDLQERLTLALADGAADQQPPAAKVRRVGGEDVGESRAPAPVAAPAAAVAPAAIDGKELKVMAWNVNGLRAVLRRGSVLADLVAQQQPDVLFLAETKVDAAWTRSEGASLLPGYTARWSCCETAKGYSGTVALFRHAPLQVLERMPGSHPAEGRLLALEYGPCWLVHTYVPNAGQKLERLKYRTTEWDRDMLAFLQQLGAHKPVVWCGDLNVAHGDIDIHNPKANRNKTPGFTDAERANFGRVLEAGFVDTFRHLNPDKQQFTYWSARFGARAKNKGWRLDYFVVSAPLLPRVADSLVLPDVAGSDHVPIVLRLNVDPAAASGSSAAAAAGAGASEASP